MRTLDEIVALVENLAPPGLAESWDNVGLLLGDRRRGVARVMACLTLTPPTVREAVERRADLVVTHHPLPFRPLGRLTTDTTAGRLLLDLAAARVAVISPHTAFDSAPRGINQLLAEGLALRGITALVPREPSAGSGRCGWLDSPMAPPELAQRLKRLLAVERVGMVGNDAQSLRMVGVACGAADDLLPAALAAGCDVLVLGEARFHTCLEAEANGMALLLAGHFATERFGVERLADELAAAMPDLEVWAALSERDPIRWI